MTHVPDIEQEARRGKAVALCGRTVSVRKMGACTPKCEDCDVFSQDEIEAVWEGRLTFIEWADLVIGRRGFIRVRKALARRRWRK